MRIIKQAEIGKNDGKVRLLTFSEFPEELIQEEAESEGGERQSQQPQIDMEAVQREAAEIIQRGRDQAAQALRQANEESERLRSQLQQESDQQRAQAARDAENTKKEGYASGYSSGEEEGYKKGYDDGYGKGKQAAMDEASNAVNMMQQVIEQLKAYHVEILAESQKDIIKMALAVAEKVLHKEIMSDPNTVIGVVKNALSKVGFKRQFVIHVNPLDLEVLKSAGDQIRAVLDGYESLKFKASPQVEPGGCIVQTESGTVDAQVDRQFEEVKETVLKAIEGEE